MVEIAGLWLRLAVQAKEARPVSQGVPVRARVGLPLPLQAEPRVREIVAGGRRGGGWRKHQGPPVHPDRLADAVAVWIIADHGPAVAPYDRLQMHHAAVHALVLEVQEPPSARGIADECTLVGSVDGGCTLGEHNAVLVGAADSARPEHR